MAKYMIHAVPRRMWYVEQYLIPSLLKQGIDKENILIYNDIDREGNLKSCMKSFALCTSDGGTWHLQDDVCICKDFKKRTEQYDKGLVCGFSSKMYDGEGNTGVVDREKMWFSFPCIRIPNDYATGCVHWTYEYMIGNPVYKRFWQNGVNDDWIFKQYLKDCHKDCTALNLAPNLVDHIDFLIGGSTGEKHRQQPVRAQYWTDDDVVADLTNRLTL